MGYSSFLETFMSPNAGMSIHIKSIVSLVAVFDVMWFFDGSCVLKSFHEIKEKHVPLFVTQTENHYAYMHQILHFFFFYLILKKFYLYLCLKKTQTEMHIPKE